MYFVKHLYKLVIFKYFSPTFYLQSRWLFLFVGYYSNCFIIYLLIFIITLNKSLNEYIHQNPPLLLALLSDFYIWASTSGNSNVLDCRDDVT